MSTPIVCRPKSLSRDRWVAAAKRAVSINPANYAHAERLAAVLPRFNVEPLHIAVMTTKYWGTGGVKLTVGFLDNFSLSLRRRILSHMNAWAKSANVEFTESNTDPQVRIDRRTGGDGGYWSYVGTDVLEIPSHEPTMNLEGFTMSTPESEFVRVVRHETGHTLGFPHEHMRRQIVSKIDRHEAERYFHDLAGWSPEEVQAQVLTPLEESSIFGTPDTDETSIMCYHLPGRIMSDGEPVFGGEDINEIDYAFAARIYPKGGSPVDLVTHGGGGVPTEPGRSAGSGDVVLMFAPGTSPRYVAAVLAAVRGG